MSIPDASTTSASPGDVTSAGSPGDLRRGFASEYPFDSHSVDIDGLQYHYVDEGTGPVLLCVHGNPTWSFAWRKIVQEFSDTHRVIAVDHIGCGLSEKPQDWPYRLENHIANLQTFIQKLDLSDISLVAHDWGGAIGMGAAGRMPERFRRFTLMNTAAFRSTAIPWRIAVCRIPVFGAIALRGLNGFSRAALFMAVEKHDRMTAAVKRGYLAPYNSWRNRIGVHRFVQDIPLHPSHPSYETLLSVEQGLAQFRNHPVQLIWGTRDWCFTTDFHDQFLDHFPEAESLLIEDAGHYVFEDAPEQILPALRRFLSAPVAD